MTDKDCCGTCIYYRMDEEYWHDHYLIPEHHYCIYKSIYSKEEVEPDGCCENYKSRTNGKPIR